MNENAQWQMIKDSVLFALSSGFSVSLFHFYLKKKSTRGVLFCISSFLTHLAKGNVSFCHHLASVVRRLSSINFSHFNLLL
jgi:hypothetical protein